MWLSSVFLFGVLCTATHAAKILGVFMMPSYSHQITFQPIWKELSLRGHEVTVYTPSPLNDPSLTNLTEYDLSFSYKIMETLGKAGFDVSKLFDLFTQVSEAQLKHPYMQDLIHNANNNTFDILLVEFLWLPYFAFKDIYNVPFVGITSLPLTLMASESLGMWKHPILEPEFLLGFSQAETFKQRVTSWAFNIAYRLIGQLKMTPTFEAQLKKYFKTVSKSARDLAKEVDLVLGNYNSVLQNVKPMVPKFVPLGGIHLHPQQPLPLDLEEFLANLQNDVIYFSLGTNVNPTSISKMQLAKIYKVLGELPYTVLFKHQLENLPEDLPKNFYVKEWFPQQDVLGHPKVKLFVTQGGIQSLDEAISRKVPMVIIPFLGDQQSNAARCAKLGIAEVINFQKYTEEEFKEKVNLVLSDITYQQNIEKQNFIFEDQPISSLDKAIFWIEYVLRHNGTSHLNYAGVDVPFYQFYHLDIFGFLAAVIWVFIFVARKIFIVAALSIKAPKKLVLKRNEKRTKFL
ncbi:UDP-glycosyltransferase UGT4 [Dendroctonus ponderosae]|uniref:UDP-glucuronosyltransferase n=1 Tax=Dendroctonus ponderosae TaxID=77166 RepID=J3JUZ2_DENPD